MSAQSNDPNSLENIAATLKELADNLERGKLLIGSRLVSVGTPFSLKTKQKISGNTAYFDLSFRVPIQDLNHEKALTDGQQKKSQDKKRDGGHEKELRLKGRHPEGKKIKKDISRLWKSIYKKLEQGQFPTPAEKKSLFSAFEDYTLFSEPAWKEEWLACFAILQKALDCASAGDIPNALEYAAKVNSLTKACHNKHK